MSKKIIFSAEARQKILSGVTKLADAVRITMGAKGRNVIMKQKYGSPLITNDGVTIAKEITLKDEFENMGAEIVKEVASRTNDEAGDGTTTATVLTHAIFSEGLKYLMAGANAMSIKQGINDATQNVVEKLKKQSVKIDTKEQKKQIATISAQSEEVGSIIADMMERVGDDGVITVEESNTVGITTEVVEGMKLESGYLSPYFVNNQESQKAEFKNAAILVTDVKIATTQELLPIINALAQSGKKELVIISADGAEPPVLADLVVNKMKGIFSSLVVRCPGFGERKKDLLKDIACITGARFISNDLGEKLNVVEIKDLGNAEKVSAERDNTIIVGGKGDKEELSVRVAQIKAEISKNESEFEKEKLTERLARLSGGIGVIRVGAATEVEQREKQHRVEDAVEATRAAVEEGIVAGGGVALVLASNFTSEAEDHDEKIGYEILKKAILMPARQIAENAGRDGGAVVAEIQRTGLGFNVQKDCYEDMIKSGIIDPVKVVRLALENSASAASILLTTEAAIVDELDEPTEKKQ